MIIKKLRKNIGTVIAALGFLLLCVVTFGDLGIYDRKLLEECSRQSYLNRFSVIGTYSYTDIYKAGVGRAGFTEWVEHRMTKK